MISHFIAGANDLIRGLNEPTNFFPAPFFPSSSGFSNGWDGGSIFRPPGIFPPLTPTPPTEAVEAQAAVTQSGSGGPGSVVAITAGTGLTINLIYDAAAMAAPASFRAGIEQAAAILSATISDKIAVNIKIDYSGTGGGAAAGPDNGQFLTYSTVKTDLINNETPGDTTFNSLPSGSSVQGQSQVAVWNAQLKLWGVLGANDTTTDDGSATFATDINPSLLVGVALHELTHALGRVPYGSQPDIFDLFRFTSAGTMLFSGSSTAPAAYFSVNGGVAKIADYGQTSDPSDFLNSGVQGGTDPFDEFYSSSTLQILTAADKEQLDALGFHIASTTTTTQSIVVAATASQAVQGGAAVTLLSGPPNITDSASTTLSSATIKIANGSGNAVAGDLLFVNGVQNGSVGNGVTASWNASTDTLTLTGSATIAVYDTLLSQVSYQDAGADASSGNHPVRTVTWTVNDGTNTLSTTSQITIDRLPVANNDGAADAAGATVTATAFAGVLSNDNDFDGDKLTVTGVSDVANGVGSVGASLAGVYGHLTLNADGSYSYVADISSAINSAPTGGHLQEAFTYTVSDGNSGTAKGTLTVTLDRPAVVTATNIVITAGTSVAASSLFAASDPDGDTIATYAFKDTGSGHFVLNGVAQANNQEIDVTAAQLSQLTYVSAAGSTDTVQVRVNDGTVWSNWTSFTVTAPIVIEAFGSTSLVQVGNNYYFYPVAGGTGPELKRFGSPAKVGQVSPPFGVEKTSSGYEVAFKNATTGQFSIWNTDNNGNYVSSTAYSGTSTALETLETSFHQDLNGDGTIGIPGVPSATTSSIVASSSTVTANGNSTAMLTVTVKDASGHAVAGTAVTLSASGSSNTFGAVSGTTDANGVFTTTLASTLAQTETITAKEGSVQEQTSVTFVAGAASATTSSIVASSPTVAADGISTTTLTVTVKDAHGNAVAGTAVTLSAGGSSNSFGAISGTTDANGKFTTTLASTLVQNETVTATEGSLTEQTSVSFVSGVPSATTSSIVTSSPTVTADGSSTTTLTVTVKDTSGHAVADTAVTLSGSGSANSFGAVSGTTDANGVFTTTLASTLAQNETITAKEGSVQEQTSVTFVAGAASATTSSIVASSPTVVADGISTTTLTVTVEDAQGNAVAGTAVTLSGGGSNNTFGAVSGTTNASGVLTTTLASTLVQNETITASEGSVQEHTSVNFVAKVSGTVIESFGSTKLDQVGNNYFLDPVAGGTGVELKYNGSPVISGQFKTNATSVWTLIGAEQTATGYEVAWKVGTTGTYWVWATDSTGNYTSNLYQPGSGTTTAFENLETSFHQDLNGDGVIGIKLKTLVAISPVSQTSLTMPSSDNSFVFRSDLGSAGVANGTAATIAAESGGFWPASNPVQDMQINQTHLLVFANESPVMHADPGNHDALSSIATHFANLHASDFMIR